MRATGRVPRHGTTFRIFDIGLSQSPNLPFPANLPNIRIPRRDARNTGGTAFRQSCQPWTVNPFGYGYFDFLLAIRWLYSAMIPAGSSSNACRQPLQQT